jgi:hypothetical protein
MLSAGEHVEENGLPSGSSGAPKPPCMVLQNTRASSDWDRPHMSVEAEKPTRLQN